jgi:hypothetical protein
VANVGDSRAVLAEREEGGGGRLLACELSMDQTPFRWGAQGRLGGVPAAAPPAAAARVAGCQRPVAMHAVAA